MDCLMRDGTDDTAANATMRQTQRVLQNGGVYVSVSGVPPERRMPIFSKMAKGARLDNPVYRECLLSRPKLAVAMEGQLFMSKKVYLYACSKPYDSNASWATLEIWSEALSACREPLRAVTNSHRSWSLGASAIAELARVEIENASTDHGLQGEVHVVVVGAAANGFSRQLGEVLTCKTRWTCVDPFGIPVSEGRSRSRYKRSGISWITADIVDSEDFLSALNFSARDQRKSLPLILDFGVLDALANLSGSAAIGLVERYVNGVLTAVRPRGGGDANQGGQWLLVSRQSPSMIACVVTPLGGVLQSAFSIPSVDGIHREAFFAYYIGTSPEESRQRGPSLIRTLTIDEDSRALEYGIDVKEFVPPQLPHTARRMAEPDSIPRSLRRGSALLGLRPGPRSLAELLKSGSCRRIIVMSGAGISVSSGIPDFRSPTSGLYARLAHFSLPKPEAMFALSYFKENPAPFTTLVPDLFPGQYLPTRTHYFVKLLEKKRMLLRLYTQNIDGLEYGCGIDPERAAFWHGSFSDCHCVDCSRQHDIRWYRARVLEANKDSLATGRRSVSPPRCLKCGGLVKPDVTFFGEKIRTQYQDMVCDDFPRCDLLIVVGTSLRVMPFAALIGSVPSSTPRLLINKEPTGLLGDPHNPSGFGNRGFRFHLDDNYRDVAMLGDCDSSITRLCRMCDWMEDLLEVERECLREHQGEPNLLWEKVAASQRKADDILPAELATEDLAPGPGSSSTVRVLSDSAPQIDDTAAMLLRPPGQSPVPGDLEPITFPTEGRGVALEISTQPPALQSNDDDPVNDTSADDRSTLARPYESLISSFRHSLRLLTEACSVLEIRNALSSLAEATMKEAQVELLCEDKARLRVHQERRANLDAYLVRRSPSDIPESAKQAAVEYVWLVEEGTGTLHLPTADTVKEVTLVILTDIGIHSRPPSLLLIAGTVDGVLFVGDSAVPPPLLPPESCLRCPVEDISARVAAEPSFRAWRVPLGASGFYCEPLIMDDWEVLKKTLRANRERLKDSGIRPSDITLYLHKREVQGCIERWRQSLVEGFAYYSGIWHNGKEGERSLAGMIWFEKFTRVCPETSVPFCFLDVSYWVADCAEGQGLVSTAVMVMTSFVKEELCAGDNVTEVLLYCRDDNLRSQAVARRLGFIPTTNANADNCFTLQLDDMWHSSQEVKWRIAEGCYKLEESEHSYDEEARGREAVLRGREILCEFLTQKIIPDSMEIDRLLELDGGRSAIASLRERLLETQRNQWQAMQPGRVPTLSHFSQYRGEVLVGSSQASGPPESRIRRYHESMGSLAPLESLDDVWQAIQGTWVNSLNHRVFVKGSSLHINGLISSDELKETSVNGNQCIGWMKWYVDPSQSDASRMTWLAKDYFSTISSTVVWRRV
ncbi:NAD-dependent protein deacetylase sirtuin-2 [Perkinsus olseni]|uniref:NAD-dependent protein deacetylase sirtuin-2 n=1 Tax=Perkinsus olseni TaxID=32597 RepID=A0A7J6LLQ2_PEROL|nr:NAD-dependent protein deacetylase sirtuin-2 [Perkinsus olseni]